MEPDILIHEELSLWSYYLLLIGDNRLLLKHTVGCYITLSRHSGHTMGAVLEMVYMTVVTVKHNDVHLVNKTITNVSLH